MSHLGGVNTSLIFLYDLDELKRYCEDNFWEIKNGTAKKCLQLKLWFLSAHWGHGIKVDRVINNTAKDQQQGSLRNGFTKKRGGNEHNEIVEGDEKGGKKG